MSSTSATTDFADLEEPECTINERGDKYWYLHGHVHREDGPAFERIDGTTGWLIHGEYHREDGPAYESSDTKMWYRHNLLHREDGPAIECLDTGDNYWMLNGIQVEWVEPNGESRPCQTQEEFERWLKMRAFW
jgi:hypothetical protein